MTISKFTFVLVAIFAIGVTFTACESKSGTTTETEQTTEQGKEYTSAYICPMHCEGSGSETAGTCPVCGMDYVKNEANKSGADDHENHEGHNH